MVAFGNEVGVWAIAGISAMAQTRLRAEAECDDVDTTEGSEVWTDVYNHTLTIG